MHLHTSPTRKQNPASQGTIRKLIPLITASVLTAFMSVSTHAANYTWTGGGGNANWTTDANWDGGTAPVGNAGTGPSEIIYLGLTSGTTVPVVDLNNPWYAQSLNFVANSSNVSLSGNTVSLSSTGSVINANVVGTFTHTISNNLVLTSSVNFAQVYSGAAATGNLSIAGDILVNYSAGGSVLFRGAGNSSTVTGKISSGTGKYLAVVKSNTGVWTFSNSSSVINEFDATQGTAKIGVNNGIGSSAALVLGNSGNTGAGIYFDLNGHNQALTGLSVSSSNNAANTTLALTNTSGTAATVTYNRGADQIYSGQITGNLSFVKAGANAFTLTGAGGNTYTGTTLINAGSLVLGNATALTSTGLVTIDGGRLSSSVSTTTLGSGLSLHTGYLTPGGSGTIGAIAVANGKNFSMDGGELQLTLGTSFDQIAGSGSSVFSITGGTLSLDITGPGFSYANTYQILNGFASGSVSNLTIIGYDSAQYLASLSNTGALSFQSVPEPSSLGLLLSAGLAVLCFRKRMRDRID